MENKRLKIVGDPGREIYNGYVPMLSNLAIAESNLIRAGKQSALPHFIAIVKELERIFGFEFQLLDETDNGN